MSLSLQTGDQGLVAFDLSSMGRYQDIVKLQASLARKGFDFDVIKRVVKNAVKCGDEDL